MRIEILGRGCRRCRAAELNLQAGLEESGIEARITRVTDTRIIRRRGVIETPTVFVDGQVLWSGIVPSVKEVKTRLTRANLTPRTSWRR